MLLGSRSMPSTLVSSSTSSAVTSALHEQVVDRQVELARVDAQADGERALRVEVDEQHPLPGLGQRGAQVDGGGRLADAALLVDHGDDPRRPVRRRGDGSGNTGRGRPVGPRTPPLRGVLAVLCPPGILGVSGGRPRTERVGGHSHQSNLPDGLEPDRPDGHYGVDTYAARRHARSISKLNAVLRGCAAA